MTTIIPVILSGGSGTRLWPASRSMYPKQLLPLVSEATMLQETAARIRGIPGASRECLIVCNEAHRFLVAEQMEAINTPARIILEPEARNTAPAVARPSDSAQIVSTRGPCSCHHAAASAPDRSGGRPARRIRATTRSG